jgi:hypothetical protein
MSHDTAAFYDGLAPDYHLVYHDGAASVERQGETLDRLIVGMLGPGLNGFLDRARAGAAAGRTQPNLLVGRSSQTDIGITRSDPVGAPPRSAAARHHPSHTRIPPMIADGPAYRHASPSVTALIAEAVVVALVISLGTLWGGRLLGVELGAAIPAALGAAGAAVFAARARLNAAADD